MASSMYAKGQTSLHQPYIWIQTVVVWLLGHVQLFCTPMDYGLPGSSVHGISQARILDWVPISFSWGLPDPEIELTSHAWQVNWILYQWASQGKLTGYRCLKGNHKDSALSPFSIFWSFLWLLCSFTHCIIETNMGHTALGSNCTGPSLFVPTCCSCQLVSLSDFSYAFGLFGLVFLRSDY